MTTTLARLLSTGDLSLKGVKVTTWDTYNDASTINDTTTLDDTYSFDDSLECSTFFNYLFGISSGTGVVDKIMLDDRGYLFAAAINESAAITNIILFNDDNSIDLKGVVTENVTF
jgi:hypothetical protein